MLHQPIADHLRVAGLDPAGVERIVRTALDEDLRYGPDVTSAATAPPGAAAVARVVARQPGVLAGLPVAREPFWTWPGWLRSQPFQFGPTATASDPVLRCCVSRPRCGNCWARSGRC